MTHCGEKWVNMVEKHPEVCEMSEDYRRKIDYWTGICEQIITRGFDRHLVFKKFPEGAARELKKCGSDDVREKALNYICAQLKRGEKVTAPDLKNTIKTYEGGDNPTSCPAGKRNTNVLSSSPEIDVKGAAPPVTDADRERKARLNPPDACHDGESKPLTEPVKASFGALAKEPLVPGPGVPVAPQKAPCVDAKTFKLCPDGECHVKTEANTRGRVCVLWNAQCSQLPGDACYIEYRNAHRNDKKSENGFVPASQLAAANKDPGIHGGKPAIPDRTLTITFSPDQWAILGKLQKAGVADGYAGAVLFCVDEIGNRSE